MLAHAVVGTYALQNLKYPDGRTVTGTFTLDTDQLQAFYEFGHLITFHAISSFDINIAADPTTPALEYRSERGGGSIDLSYPPGGAFLYFTDFTHNLIGPTIVLDLLDPIVITEGNTFVVTQLVTGHPIRVDEQGYAPGGYVIAIPEPARIAFLVAGVVLLLAIRRNRQK
jgi:hypothetical protein